MDFGEVMMMKMLFDNNNTSKSGNNEMLQILEVMTKLQGNQQPAQNNSFSNFREILEVAKLMNPQPQNPTDSFKQNIEMFKTMLDNGEKSNQTKEILDFLKDRESNMYKSQTEIQKLKDEQYKMILDQKIEQLAKQVQSGNGENGMDFNRIAEQIRVIKELSSQITGAEHKPNAIDYIQTIGEAVGPVVSKMFEAKAASSYGSNQHGSERFQKIPEEKIGGLSEEQMMNLHRTTNAPLAKPISRAGVHTQPMFPKNNSAPRMEEEMDEESDDQNGEEESLLTVSPANPNFSPKVKRGKLIPDDNTVELPGYVG